MPSCMHESGENDPLNLWGLNRLLDEFVVQYTKMGLEREYPIV